MWLRVSKAKVQLVSLCSHGPLGHSVSKVFFSEPFNLLNRRYMSCSLSTSSGKAKEIFLFIFKIPVH